MKKKVNNKYQQVITISFYASAQSISFLLIAQVIYLNFHYIIGASLTIIATVSLLFQAIMSITQTLYYEGHQQSATVSTLLKIQFYTNFLFTLVYCGFMIWTAVFMYQHGTTS